MVIWLGGYSWRSKSYDIPRRGISHPHDPSRSALEAVRVVRLKISSPTRLMLASNCLFDALTRCEGHVRSVGRWRKGIAHNSGRQRGHDEGSRRGMKHKRLYQWYETSSKSTLQAVLADRKYVLGDVWCCKTAVVMICTM